MQLAARQLTFHFTFRTRAAGRRLRLERRGVPVVVARRTTTQLARRGGAPQDRALYTCCCGFSWTATVSTTVGCPHCGTDQAW